jgi:hypothetical protein
LEIASDENATKGNAAKIYKGRASEGVEG